MIVWYSFANSFDRSLRRNATPICDVPCRCHHRDCSREFLKEQLKWNWTLTASQWIEQRSRPWPDFNTKHVCRDFEKVLDWTNRHSKPVGTPLIPMKPEGAMAMSSPP